MREKLLNELIEITTDKIEKEDPDERVKEVVVILLLVTILVFRAINQSDLEEEKKIKLFLAFIKKMDEFLNED